MHEVTVAACLVGVGLPCSPFHNETIPEQRKPFLSIARPSVNTAEILFDPFGFFSH